MNFSFLTLILNSFITDAAEISATSQNYSDTALELWCAIDANPPVEAGNAKWARLGYDKGTQRLVEGSGHIRYAVINIPAVTRSDLESFTCEASNEHGAATKEYTVTPVPCEYLIF